MYDWDLLNRGQDTIMSLLMSHYDRSDIQRLYRLESSPDVKLLDFTVLLMDTGGDLHLFLWYKSVTYGT